MLEPGGGINNRGDLVGFYADGAGMEHGFLRLAPSVGFITIDVPGAAGTECHQINDRGQTVGNYFDHAGVPHVFPRADDGTLTFINFPGALATAAGGLNSAGAISGEYVDSTFKFHGFIETK